MVTVSLAGDSTIEGTNNGDAYYLNFVVTLSAPATSTVTVGYRLLSGTGQATGDAYFPDSARSVTFQPGETSKTVAVRVNSDTVAEPDETVVLEVFSVTGGAALAGNATTLRATGTILDDDGSANKLALFISNPVVVEGNSGQRQASFTISLSRPAPAAFNLAYTTVDGSARAGEDYQATSGTIAFAAGQTTASVSVPILGDTTVEPSEQFTFSVTPPASVAQTSLGVATILDDDAGNGVQPVVSLAGDSTIEGTNNGDAYYLNFVVTLSAPATSTVTVGYRLLSGTGQATGDAYFPDSARSVTFQPGETSKTVAVRVNSDTVAEPDETVVLEVFSVTGGAALAGNATTLRATGTILDDDGSANKLALFISNPVVVEGNSGQRQASFTISLSRPAPAAFDLAYTTVDGSARAGEDYQATSGTIAFAAGQTTASVSVPILGDTTVEPSEQFTFSVTPPASVAQTSLGVATILDDDAGNGVQPVVSLAGDSTIEGTNNGDAYYLNFVVTLSGPATSTVTVGYRLLSGTGQATGDAYFPDSIRSVTFQPGETSKTVAVRVNSDTVAEPDETVVLEAFSVTGGAALAGNATTLRATGTILDDDGSANKLALFISNPVVVEGNSGQRQASFTISLSRPAPAAFDLAYTTVDGSARAGEDYQATSGTIAFAAGQTTASVSVPILGDTTVEPSEQFTFSVTPPASVAQTSLGVATILDDDAGNGVQPVVSLAGDSTIEGTNNGDAYYLNFVVTLSGPATSTVTVGYRLLSGTGQATGDAYFPDSIRSVTFQPGETSKTVAVRVNADAVAEPDETVVLEAFSVTGGAVLAGNATTLRATGTILDDDGSASFQRAQPSVTVPSQVVRHVGDSGTLSLTVSNSSGDFENLRTTLVATSGGISGSPGAIAEIPAGNQGNVPLTLSTIMAGQVTGRATLFFESDGATTDGAPITGLGSQTYDVTATVDNYASIGLASSSGTITFDGTQYHLDLGTVAQGSGSLSTTLSVSNNATGPADLLSGTIGIVGNNGFANSGSGIFTSLSAGSSVQPETIRLGTNIVGSFSETLIVHGTGSNASGYSGALGDTRVLVTGSISSAAPSRPPVATADKYTTLLDGVLTIAPGSGLLVNDRAASGSVLTAALVTGPAHGALALNADGSFTYTPTNGYVGTDSFTYAAVAGSQSSNATSVSLVIVPATLSIEVPPALAPGETGTATIHYTASTNAPANLLLVKASGAQVADPLTGLFASSSLVFVPGHAPNGTSDMPVTVKLAAVPTGASPTLSVAVADPTETIDWSAQKAALKPGYVAAAAWDRIYANFTNAVGTTVGSLTQALAADETLLASFGINAQSGSAAIAFELEQAGDFGSIAARTAVGSLGQGWATIGDLGLSTGADGSVTLLGLSDLSGLFTLDAASAGRYILSGSVGLSVALDGTIVDTAAPTIFSFALQFGGTYSSAAGASLSKTASGFVLSEADGTVLRFDVSGRLTGATSPSGTTVVASYDAAGRIASFSGANGDSLSFARDASGLITGLSDARGGSVSVAYPAGAPQLASTSGAFGGASFAYTAEGDLSAINRLGTAPSTRLSYDAEGRLAGIDMGGGAQTETYAYDEVGSYSVTDGARTITSVALLPDGSVGRVTDANGGTSSLLFDRHGQLTGSRDANGATQNFRYDAMGRVVLITDANGAAISFGYTGSGKQPTSFTDAKGSTRTFSYDSAGHITGATWPDGTTLSFTYDSAGNLVSFTNRVGSPTVYAYDAAGHRTSASASAAGPTSYVYDAQGRLSSAITTAGLTTVAYDGLGRVAKITYPTGRSLSYDYDAAGRRTALTDQDGHKQLYTYDAAGRLATVGTEAGLLASYSYDAAGNLVRQADTNGTATTYTYDQAGQLTAIMNLAPDGSTSSFERYGYNANGLRVAMVTQDGSWVYMYDAEGQLTSANFRSTRVGISDKSLAYSYDAAGNRLTSVEDGVTTVYTTNALNQYTAVGDTSLAYDAAGNLVRRANASGATNYLYDTNNRVISITEANGSITTNEYDIFGALTAQAVSGTRTEYLVDPFGLGNVVAEYTNGSLISSYVQGLGLVARIDADGMPTFYQSDAVGSVTSLTDRAGTISNVYSYQPFGATLYQSQTTRSDNTFDGRYGVVLDGSGLLTMRARTYDPSTGSFISEDPLVLSGDVQNLYRFAQNNPLSYVDPSGDVSFKPLLNLLSKANDFRKAYFNPKDFAIQKLGTAAIVGLLGVPKFPAGILFSIYKADFEFQNAPQDFTPIARIIASYLHGVDYIPEYRVDPNNPYPAVITTLPQKTAQQAGSSFSSASTEASSKSAGGYGCPHFFTYDRLSFDFQGSGEFIAARSFGPGDPFEVQMRIEPEYAAESSVSIITQIAVKIGADRVTFAADRSQSGSFANPGRPSNLSQVVWVNGTPIDLAIGAAVELGSGTVFAISRNEYRVVLSTGESVVINPFGDGMGLRISLPAGASPGSIRGFLGADEGQARDFQLQDGTVLQQPLTQDQLYHQFADAWRVTDGNSLLDYRQGETTATYTNPQYPRHILTLADFPADLVAKAHAIVAAAGISDPVLADNAAFDYISMGNPSFIVEDATIAGQSLIASTSATIVEHTAPPPLLGALPASPTVTESFGDTTAVTFTVNLTSAASADQTVQYVVTPGVDYLANTAGKVFIEAADFGGALPSGSITIAAGQTSATITILVPNTAIGSAPEKWLGISIASSDSSAVYSPTAQAEIVNRNPVSGTLADPGLKLLVTSTAGSTPTLIKSGTSYALDLGNILKGSEPPPLHFALANLAAPGADRLVALIASAEGDGFTLIGMQPSTPILAGSSYSDLFITPDTTQPGPHVTTVTFNLADVNDTGFYADLSSITLIVRDTVSGSMNTTPIQPDDPGIDSGSLPGILTPVASTPVYRFFDAVYGTHLLTQSLTEAQAIHAGRPDLIEEINNFGAVDPLTSQSAAAVYRFFETSNGTHFFTANYDEYVRLTTPNSPSYRSDLIYEASSTFYEDSVQQPGDVPVYRFFDTVHGTQFLTGSQSEYAALTTAGSGTYRPDLTPEGIAFYAPNGSFST